MDCKQFFEQINGKKIAMCGIGVSNTPLILNFLNKGAKVYACDKRNRELLGEVANTLENAGAQLRLGEGYLDNLEVDIIFRTPGMNFNLPELEVARKKGIAVVPIEGATPRLMLNCANVSVSEYEAAVSLLKECLL